MRLPFPRPTTRDGGQHKLTVLRHNETMINEAGACLVTALHCANRFATIRGALVLEPDWKRLSGLRHL
ncbi:hypothetical protein CHELA41_40088 [Hyphomicrobiales bacterium]|nr:hypothetical protein CHELA41_40088 [Hyphomicrobiales bacterium]